MKPVRTVKLVQNLLVRNDEVAAANRERFRRSQVLAVNILAGPGAGKTSLIGSTLQRLDPEVRVGVVEGDIAGSVDTKRVLDAGARDAIQINTGGRCHLEADMVRQALDGLDLANLDLLFIENVGNLICPTAWDLGEAVKVCVVSAAEGDDKPVKYPAVFARSDLVVLNKIDLIDLVDFDRRTFRAAVRALNPRVPLLELSCRTGEGLEDWIDWLKRALAAPREVPRRTRTRPA